MGRDGRHRFAAPAVRKERGQLQAGGDSMQIAAMTSVIYSRRNTGEKVRAADAVRRLHAAGFDHLDLNLCGMARNENEFCGDDWEKQADEVRNTAEKLGVTFVQSHAPYISSGAAAGSGEKSFFERMLLRAADIIQIMGIGLTVVHPLQDPLFPPGDRAAHARLTRQVHRRFLDRIASRGVRPAFENMCGRDGRGRYCASSGDLTELCDDLSEYRPGICWDFGHANLSFADQCPEIERMAGRILCVHTHDNKGKNDDHLMPFIGTVPWERVLPALRKTGFSNDLVLEVAQNANMPDELKDMSTLLMAEASRILIGMFEAD